MSSQMIAEGTKPVLAVKGARVGEFNGKTLSTMGSTILALNPRDLPQQAAELRHWCVRRNPPVQPCFRASLSSVPGGDR